MSSHRPPSARLFGAGALCASLLLGLAAFAGCKGAQPPEPSASTQEDAGRPKEAGGPKGGESGKGGKLPEGGAARSAKPDAGPPPSPIDALRLGAQGWPVGFAGLGSHITRSKLRRLRPGVQASPVTDRVFTEPAAPPLLAATYRFDAGRDRLTEIRWALDRKNPRETVKALTARLTERIGEEPLTTEAGERKELVWRLPEGEMVLRVAPPVSAPLLLWRAAPPAPAAGPGRR